MVFVCTATGEVIRAEVQPTPAVNPKTKRATLMPGLYCRKCEKWYPAPPAEVLQRVVNGAACPKTGWPLYAEGPLAE
ncbi:MAG: hypothetical protein CMJ48_03100 [Planctomycetaceae bacterium]|nr:hypothetical protein [Planctomycetaceae bacterium]